MSWSAVATAVVRRGGGRRSRARPGGADLRTTAHNLVLDIWWRIGVVGWLAKALVERALDKIRLSLLLGLALGFVAAAWRAAQPSEDIELDSLEHRSGELA